MNKYNFDTKNLENFKKKISRDKILSCIIYQENDLILEYYKNIKTSLSLQTINSCTKSVISALIGIAIEKRFIENIHIPISEYFEDIFKDEIDLRKKEITIEHLLTMTPGFDWPEFGEWNCFAPMVYSKDIIKYIIKRPLLTTPGEKMNYNSGCSHLLSAIIQKTSGKTTHDFAKKYLFEPLGINETFWYEKQGVNLGSDGLRIFSKDLIKIGNVYINNGENILSEKWIQESTKSRYLTYENIGYYGYHWWSNKIKKENKEIKYYFALGYGGQFLFIIPEIKMTVVFTSRMYNNSLKPKEYFENYLL
jgi:hypothetical protein